MTSARSPCQRGEPGRGRRWMTPSKSFRRGLKRDFIGAGVWKEIRNPRSEIRMNKRADLREWLVIRHSSLVIWASSFVIPAFTSFRWRKEVKAGMTNDEAQM